MFPLTFQTLAVSRRLLLLALGVAAVTAIL